MDGGNFIVPCHLMHTYTCMFMLTNKKVEEEESKSVGISCHMRPFSLFSLLQQDTLFGQMHSRAPGMGGLNLFFFLLCPFVVLLPLACDI